MGCGLTNLQCCVAIKSIVTSIFIALPQLKKTLLVQLFKASCCAIWATNMLTNKRNFGETQHL